MYLGNISPSLWVFSIFNAKALKAYFHKCIQEFHLPSTLLLSFSFKKIATFLRAFVQFLSRW